MDAYIEEVFESENVRSPTRISCKILDAKYEKAELNKFMNKKFQHQSEDQKNYLPRLLQKFEDFFNEALGTWKRDTIDF